MISLIAVLINLRTYERFHPMISLIAVLINSLYCNDACKHYRTKFYFGVSCINSYYYYIKYPLPN